MRRHFLSVTLIACLLTATPVIAWADPIWVGGIEFEIPAPRGFVKVSTAMKSAKETIASMALPRNKIFVAFVPESEANADLAGQPVEITRLMTVDVPEELVGELRSNAQFHEFKKVVKTEAAKSQSEFEHRSLEESETLEVDEKRTSPRMLAAHHETDRSISASAHSEIIKNDEAGNPTVSKSTTTFTIVSLKSKILVLYAFGGEGDLEWTRQSCHQWAGAVIAANPPDLRTFVREIRISDLAKLDRLKLLRTAMLVFVVVGMIWIALMLLSWRKKPVPLASPNVMEIDRNDKHQRGTFDIM